MPHDKHFDKQLLLNSPLIVHAHKPQAARIIEEEVDPVARLIAERVVEGHEFYPRIAQLYELSYVSDINTSISTHTSLAQSVPLRILAENVVFPYEQENSLFIACTSPFLPASTIQTVLSYTKHQAYTLTIACPGEIYSALNNTFYTELSVSTEDRIHVLHPQLSTKTYNNVIIPKVFPIATLVCWLIMLIATPYHTLWGTFVFFNVVYFFINPLKIFVFMRSFHPVHELKISAAQLSALTDAELPTYTLLVPLMHEASVVPHLVKNLFALDYPIHKLDIKFIVELGDEETIAALEKAGIGVSSPDAHATTIASQLVKVPQGSVLTKPRSCNYALSFARGAFTVIYDAEDHPEPDQLKKAFAAFLRSTLDAVCVQARLNFYDSRQNLLTRLFSLEYSFWFDFYLPGLHETSSPIPLGGTSNHFVTSYLRKIGTWDPYNVTEDADLGLRLFRYKFKTVVMNSHTYEEANSHMHNWLRQRTRWQKGYLLTFLVHTSNPYRFIKELGLKNALISTVTFGSSFFLPLFNPVLWFVFLLSVLEPIVSMPLLPIPPWIQYLAIFNLIAGNLTYIVIHLVAAIHSRRYDLLLALLILPAYWLFISVATIRAMVQFMTNPFYWEKTHHGLHLTQESEADVALGATSTTADIYYKP